MLSYWQILPLSAKRYIPYHCLVTPLLFVWYLVPYLMLESGLSVTEAGFIFTISSAVGALLTLL